MMIRPNLLRKGDTIALVSPAKSIDVACIDFAKKWLEQQGFRVIVGKNASGIDRYFSGTDEERAADLQWAIDHPEVKAIVCNRGGYGAIRLLDRIQWANLLREPKWIVGFSDITNFHCQALQLGVESIHATMPLNYQENTPESLDSFLSILTTGGVSHEWKPAIGNVTGSARGTVVGGNLSIVFSLLGTPLCPNFENAILFIEDVGEQYYHLDRMLQAMKMAGVFEQISGLIIGGMTDMVDTATPTQWTVRELVLGQLAYTSIPVCFDVPIGHQSDNRAVVVGRISELHVSEQLVTFLQ
jgi:muramoyltetrapeptide carboxypeptidase